MPSKLQADKGKQDQFDLLSLGLDWKLAAQRLNQDIQDDFWPDPLGLKDLLYPLETAVQRLKKDLRTYRPQRGTSCEIPKANLTIRDSIQTTGLDRLVYQALIDRLIPYIDPILSQNVFSHRLRPSQRKFIFYNGVSQYKKFLGAVRRALRRRPNGVLVTADVAKYYEFVSFRALRKQFENMLPAAQLATLQPCIEMLCRCLKGWSPYGDYGLVQNVDASSFLGNVLLDHVDRHLESDGYDEAFRYMDDIRIVVPTEADCSGPHFLDTKIALS